MLVAGVGLSLLAPIGTQASNINIEEIDTYVRKKSTSKKQLNSKTFSNKLATRKQKVKSSEPKFNEFEAGGFSDTTTLDGKVIMALGAINEVEELKTGLDASTTFNTVYQMNLNTSFSGDDNLYIRLKGGEWADEWKMKGSTYHIEAKDTADANGQIALNVDKIWYTFPIGESITATVGPKIENYYMLAATPSVYKPGALKAFKLGGHSAAFGASTSVGGGLKYEAENGFASSITLNSKGATSSTKGILTDEDTSKVNTMIAYTADQYHASVTYSKQTGGWDAWSYYATTDVASSAGTGSDSYAFRAWWRPEETGTAVPSISAGYDIINFEGHTLAENASGYMVGLNWQDTFQPDDRIGIAIGSVLSIDDHKAGVSDTEVDPFLWEAYYSFKPNDSILVTPAIFGGTDVEADEKDDIFGAVVTTTFKF